MWSTVKRRHDSRIAESIQRYEPFEMERVAPCSGPWRAHRRRRVKICHRSRCRRPRHSPLLLLGALRWRGFPCTGPQRAATSASLYHASCFLSFPARTRVRGDSVTTVSLEIPGRANLVHMQGMCTWCRSPSPSTSRFFALGASAGLVQLTSACPVLNEQCLKIKREICSNDG